MSCERKLVNFVRESQKNNSEEVIPPKKRSSETAKLSGDEARNFYEQILKSNEQELDSLEPKPGKFICTRSKVSMKTPDIVEKSKQHKSAKYSRKHERQCGHSPKTRTGRRLLDEDGSVSRVGFHLLKLAQDGDLDGVKRQLEFGTVDVQFQDSYGWTALMCATYNGHVAVVRYLLQSDADASICDRLGKNARELAKSRKHVDIMEILDQHRSSSLKNVEAFQSGSSSSLKNVKADHVTFHCDVCKSDFTDTSLKSHNTSTLHLFNSKLKPKPTTYFIPESNKGFQMMVKHGWDTEKGLGPGGQGQKFPVKTVLKQNRHGLGAKPDSKVKPRITHFSANDTTAVVSSKCERVMKCKTLSKKRQIKKQNKAREWERNLRIYMNTE